jgi:hypothetical protein
MEAVPTSKIPHPQAQAWQMEGMRMKASDAVSVGKYFMVEIQVEEKPAIAGSR